jgi:hypothetical protein
VKDGLEKYAVWVVEDVQLTATFPAVPTVLYWMFTDEPDEVVLTGELAELRAAANADATVIDELFPGWPYETFAVKLPTVTDTVPAS